MGTVTPWENLKYTFSVNVKGEKKPGKNGITLELEEFRELVKVIPKVQDSIAKYELRDTRISSSPFELDLRVLDLDTVFLPSPPSQEPIPVIQNFFKVLSLFQSFKVLHHHHLLLLMYPHHSSTLLLKRFCLTEELGNSQKLRDRKRRKSRIF